LNGDWLISADKFEETMESVRKLNEKFTYITAQPYNKHVSRYFHIYPNGDTHIIIPGMDGFPVELSTGNIGKNFKAVIKNLSGYDLTNNENR
jgi:uncharacterized protein (DUF4213/DUF364 family)